MIRAVVKGSGSALPKRVVSNAELAQQVDTSDEWIRERTGITQRYIAGEGETTASLATDAARAALADAGIDAAEVDLIVLATATPNRTFPPPPPRSSTRSAATAARRSTSARSARASSTPSAPRIR